MVNIRVAKQIVSEELAKWAKKGYKTETKFSQTTNSCYYIISDGKTEIAFRLSDHPAYHSNPICTLDVSYRKTTVEQIRAFVANRVSGLRQRGLESFFSRAK